MVNLITAIRNDDFKTIEKWVTHYPSVIQKYQQKIYDHVCELPYGDCNEKAQQFTHWLDICPFLISCEQKFYSIIKSPWWCVFTPILIRRGVKYPISVIAGSNDKCMHSYRHVHVRIHCYRGVILAFVANNPEKVQDLVNYLLRKNVDIIGYIPNDKRLSIDESNVERVCRKEHSKWDATLKNLVHHGVILTQKHINMCIQSRNLTRVEYCKAVVHLQAIYIALETYTTIPHIIQRIIAKFYGPRNIDIEIPLPVRQETNKKRKCVII